MALVDYAWYVSKSSSTHGYFGTTQWSTGAKTAGAIVRQVSSVTTGTERLFIALTSGTSGGSQPAWVLTRGAKTTDNTVTWQEITGVAAINGDVAHTPDWTVVKNTVVDLGQVIKNVVADHYFIASTAGTAGNGAEPSWNTTTGGTTADNTITWTCIGAVASFTQCYKYAHATLSTANSSGWGQNGNIFYIWYGSVDSWSASISINGGTYALPRYYISTDELNTPPNGSDVIQQVLAHNGSSITVNSGTFQIGGGAGDCQYWNGLFLATNSATLQIGGGAGSAIKMVNCWTQMNSGTQPIQFGSPISGNGLLSTIEYSSDIGLFANTLLISSGTNVPFQIQGGNVIFRNVTMQITNTSTAFFAASSNGSAHTVLCQGCEVAGSGSPTTTALVNPANLQGKYSFVNCFINSFNSQPVVSTTPTIPLAGTQIDLIDTDGSDTATRNERYNHVGTSSVTTAFASPFVFRAGGALVTNPNTNYSRQIVTNANATWPMPFEDFPMAIYYNFSNRYLKTVNIYCFLNGGGAIPDNGDIWVELQYISQTGEPQSSSVTSSKANILSIGTQYSSDTSVWGFGLPGTAFVMSTPTFEMDLSGYIYATVKVGKPSFTVYYDPVIYVV